MIKSVLFFQILTLLLPQVFSDNMVLQQGRDVPVWGTAAAKESVTVTLTDEGGAVVAKAKTKADKEGAWMIQLPSMKAEGKTYTLAVDTRKESVKFSNVAVGEVWLCSGQSNMAYEMRRSWQRAPLKGEDLCTAELQKPANPMIRVFIPGRPMRPGAPAPAVKNGWKVADGTSLAPVSAVGYFFAKNISEQLGVPVGIISSASGGSEIEQWLPGGSLYGFGIKALMPYAIGGFLWYQGESNLAHKTTDYLEKYVALTEDWRSGFNSPDAPFYSVLLAPHTYSDRLHRGSFVTSEALPIFWQIQMNAAKAVKNSEIICITDLIDTPEDIHPSYKWIVGQRLAKLALKEHFAAEGATEWCGPRASSLRIDGDKAIVSFEHCAEGLKGRSNSVEPNSTPRLKWFEVAGADGIWHQALAEICGKNEVAVSHPEVAKPVSVRFAWRETAQPNLFNSEDLPAFPFVIK